MAMKFYGSLERLKQLLDRHDILGSWERECNGVHMMRCPDGSNLHWASGSKSLWIDGKDKARRALAINIAGLLHNLADD